MGLSDASGQERGDHGFAHADPARREDDDEPCRPGAGEDGRVEDQLATRRTTGRTIQALISGS
jgi:hypothetical protein